jgi:hypothetical protein
MEKVVEGTKRGISRPGPVELLSLARDRVALPDVDMDLDYQDDVDTLIIRFKEPVSDELLECLSDEKGVMPIYNPELTLLVGIEILDISGQLQYADLT